MDFPKFLRIVSIPSTVSVQVNDTHSIQKSVFGNFEDMLTKILSQKMGFNYEFVAPDDRKWGSLQQDGSWNGMVGVLQRKEADLIIRALTITEDRRQAINFSFPYYVGHTVFATRNLERSPDGGSFLKPFSIGVWTCLLACIFAIPVLHSILFSGRQGWKKLQDAYATFLESSEYAPIRFGEYAFRMSLDISLAFVFWMYAAVLLSFLTVPTLTGVRNIPELANAVRQGRFQCTAYPGAFFADDLLKSEDADFKEIGADLKKDEGSVDFNAVLSNAMLPKRPAYIAEESKFFGLQAKYFVSGDSFFQDFRAIGIRRGFCCRDKLDSAVHDIWASGIYMKLMTDFRFKEASKILWEPVNESKERPLTLADFYGVFILLIAGYVLATIVFVFELIFKIIRNTYGTIF